jgi:dTDP-4-amino-4,6-dideoxygalactose transaminase
MQMVTHQAPDGVRSTYLPFARPSIDEGEINAVIETLRSGWLTTGPRAQEFEQRFREYVAADHAIAVSSCTAGLEIALAALGVGSGDEVIVPTLTFCASANVVVHLGARPRLVDVGPDFNVTPEAIRSAINERTRAIMVVHYGGQACDLEEIYRIALQHDLPVIEDAAHAVGSGYRGNRIGASALPRRWADSRLRNITVFSFYANKNLTTGEGGMIVTGDSELAATMRRLMLHGMDKDAWARYTALGSWYYEVREAGYKANLPDLAAALGLEQLRRIEDFTHARRRLAALYTEHFAQLPAVEVPLLHEDRAHAYHLYVLRLVPEHCRIGRNDLIEELRRRNIGTSVHFIPVHLQPFYREKYGHREGDYPVAEDLFGRIVSLPLYPAMTEQDACDVVVAMRGALGGPAR